MKKLFIPFLAVSLLSLCLAPLHMVTPAYAEEGEGKPDKKKDNNVSGGRFEGDPIYVHIEPMTLPVINENGVEQLVTLILDVQVKNFDTADQLHTNMPRVMDSLLRSFYGGLGQGTLRKGKIVDVSKVKTKAIAAVGEIVGTDNINDVLVQGVAQRIF